MILSAPETSRQIFEKRMGIRFEVEGVEGVLVYSGRAGGTIDGLECRSEQFKGGLVVNNTVESGQEQINGDFQDADDFTDGFIQSGAGDEKEAVA